MIKHNVHLQIDPVPDMDNAVKISLYLYLHGSRYERRS